MSFTTRHLTMNYWANAIIYSGVIMLTNECLRRVFDISEATALLVAISISLLYMLENRWVREIKLETG